MSSKSLLNPAIIVAVILSVSACGDKESAKTQAETPAQADEAARLKVVFIKALEDNTREKGVTDKYKICQESQPGYADTVMFLYNKELGQLKYDKQKEAEAKAAGKEFKNTWSLVRSAKLVDQCPSGAAGRCEVSNIISYYYTESPVMTAHFKKVCAYMTANVWTENP